MKPHVYQEFVYQNAMDRIHCGQVSWFQVLFLLLLGAALTFTSMGYPRAIVFDETYIIPNAQSYINGVYFQDSHPPLGRLLVALGQIILHPGELSNEFVHVSKIEQDWPNSLDISGYRLIPAILGSINPLFVFSIVSILTNKKWIAFFSGLALLLDNALLTQSRFALTDSILISFSLASILCFMELNMHGEYYLGYRERLMWATFGFFAGAAFMVKFTGLFVLIVVPFYIYELWKRKNKRKIIGFLLVAGVSFTLVFVLVWGIHFSVLRIPPLNFNEPISELHLQVVQGTYAPNIFSKFWIEVTDAYHYIFEYHKNVPALDLSKPDEIGSPWYFWPFGGRAISYRWESDSHNIRIIYLIGNPVTWLISLLGVIGASATVIADWLFRFLKQSQRQTLYPFFCLYWGYMFSFTIINRVMYLYHYLPSLIIGVILFCLMISEVHIISRQMKWKLLLSIAICMVVAFYIYSPFTYYKEIPVERIEQLNILPVWDLKCPNC